MSFLYWFAVVLVSTSWWFSQRLYVSESPWGWVLPLLAAGLLIAPLSRRRLGETLPSPPWWLLTGAWVAVEAAMILLGASMSMPAWLLRGALVWAGISLIIDSRWSWGIATAFALVGIVSVVQMPTLGFATWLTACWKDMPGLAPVVAHPGRLLGMDIAASGSTLYIQTMRQTHALGGTVELFGVAPLLLILTGGLAGLLLCRVNRSPSRTVGAAVALMGLCFGYGLLRAVIMTVTLFAQLLYVGYGDSPEPTIALLWNPWTQLLSFLPLVLLLGRLIKLDANGVGERVFGFIRVRAGDILITCLVAAAVLLAVLAVGVYEQGPRKAGRVLIDEAHSDWERFDRPFDTNWYGQEAGYNYASIYDYLDHYFQMAPSNGRAQWPDNPAGKATLAEARTHFKLADDKTLTPKQYAKWVRHGKKKLTREVLDNYDVLVLKIPTPTDQFPTGYTHEEVDAIYDWVNDGGGLFVIGEHTGVFGSNMLLNKVCRLFDFELRDDCAFDVETKWTQQYDRPALLPHPIVAHLPSFRYETSCTIQPHSADGEVAQWAGALKNLPIDWHSGNFYPQVVNRADMRYGPFVQIYAVKRGHGRVVAFGDSTVWSNFSAFESGKPELLLACVQWCNYKNESGLTRPLLTAGALLCLLCAAMVIAYRRDAGPSIAVVSAALLVAAAAAWGLTQWNARAFPMPAARTDNPPVNARFDLVHSDYRLTEGGFIGRKGGYGLFFQWCQRVNIWPFAQTERKVLAPLGEMGYRLDVSREAMTFIIAPTHVPSEAQLRELQRYVKSGGKLIVLDSADVAEGRANAFLLPFGMQFSRYQGIGQDLVQTVDGRAICVAEKILTLEGGRPLLKAARNKATIAATVRYGKGMVLAMGLAHRFHDKQMGMAPATVPNAEIRRVYEFQFSLLRGLKKISNTPRITLEEEIKKMAPLPAKR